MDGEHIHTHHGEHTEVVTVHEGDLDGEMAVTAIAFSAPATMSDATMATFIDRIAGLMAEPEFEGLRLHTADRVALIGYETAWRMCAGYLQAKAARDARDN